MPPPQQLLSSSLSFKCLNFYLKVYLTLLFILISAHLPLSAPSDCDEARQWPNFCFALKNSTLLSESAQKELMRREGRAQEMFCDMARLLSKIDCDQPYSVNQNQSRQCQEAYRDWACSVIVESIMDENEFGKNLLVASGSLMPFPSCDSICHRVLRVCPYLTPDRNQLIGPSGHLALHPSQYGGHPAFYCPIRSGLFFAAFKASRSGGSGTNQLPVHHRYFYRSGSEVNLTDELISSNDTSCCWTYSAALKTEQYGSYNSDDPTPTDLDDIIQSFSYNDGDHEDGGFDDSHKIPYRELLGNNQVQIQCLHVERPKQSHVLSSSAHHPQVTDAEEELEHQQQQLPHHAAFHSHPPVAHSDFQTSRLLHSPASGNAGSGHEKGREPTSPHSHSQPSKQALSRPMSRSVNTPDADIVAKVHLNGQTNILQSQDSSESNYNYLHDDWFDVVSPRSKSIQKRNNYNFLNLVSSSSSDPSSKEHNKLSQGRQHEQQSEAEQSSVLSSDVSGEEEDTVSLYDGGDGVDGLEEDVEDPDNDLLDGEEGLDHGGSDVEGEEGTMSTRSSEDSPHRRRQEAAIMDQDFISTVSARIERSISSLSSAQEHAERHHQRPSAKSSGSRPELFIEKLLPFRVHVNVNLSRFLFTNILPLPSFLTNHFNVNAYANKNTNILHHHHHNHHISHRCFPVLLFNILLLLIIILLLFILVLLTTNFLPILLQILYTTAHYVSSSSPPPKSVVQFPCQGTRPRLTRLPPAKKRGSTPRRERNWKYDAEEIDGREEEAMEASHDWTMGGRGGEVTQFSSVTHPSPNNHCPPVSVTSEHEHESETTYQSPHKHESMIITFWKSNNNNTNKIIIKMINTDSTGRKTLGKDTKHTYTNKIITTNTSIILSGQIILISKPTNTIINTKPLPVNNLRSDLSQYHSRQYSCYCQSQVLVASRLVMILSCLSSSSQLPVPGLGHSLFPFHLFRLLLLLSKSEHLIGVLTVSATRVLVNERKIEKVAGVDLDLDLEVTRKCRDSCVQFQRCVQMSLVWTLSSALAPGSASVFNSIRNNSTRPSSPSMSMVLKNVDYNVALNWIVRTSSVVDKETLELELEPPPRQLIILQLKLLEMVGNNKMNGNREFRVSVLLVAMDRELKLNVVKRLFKCRHTVDGSNYFDSRFVIILVIRRQSHPIIISRLRFFQDLLLLRRHHIVWVVHRLSDVDRWNLDSLDLPMLRHRHPLLFLKCTTRIRMNFIKLVIMTDDDTDNIASTFVTSSTWLRYRNDNRSSGCRRTIKRMRRSSRSRRDRRCPLVDPNNKNNSTVSKMITVKLENSSTMIVYNINNKIKNKIIHINNIHKNIEEVTCRNNNKYYYSRPLLLLSVVLLTRFTLRVSMMIVNKSKLLVLAVRWEKGKLLLLLLKLRKSQVMRISMLLVLSTPVFIPWEKLLVLKFLVVVVLLLLLLVLPQSPVHLLRLQIDRTEQQQSQKSPEQDTPQVESQSVSHNFESYSYYSDCRNEALDYYVSCCRVGILGMNQGIILTDPVRDRQQLGQSISILPKTVSDELSLKFLNYSKQKRLLLEGQSEILVVLSLLAVDLHSMSNNQRSFSASNTITEVNYYYRYNIIVSHKHIDTL